MPEVATKLKTFRFDQMAAQVKDKVHPDEVDVDRYVGLEHIDPESLTIRRWGEPSDVQSTKILFRAGDIIFGKRRAYQRKLAVADFDGICSAHAMVLRPNTDVVLKEFLPFFMQTDTFMERAVKISVGGLSPTINWSDLAREEFALPPIEVQLRLSTALLALERTMETLASLRSEQSKVRIAHLSDFFEPRYRTGQPLSEVVSVVSGGTPSKKNEGYWGGDRPWASGKDLKGRRLCDTELHLTDEGWMVAKVAPERSTLIVVRGMILAHTFPVCCCAQPTAINQDLRALVAKPPLVPEYVTLWAEWAGPWFLNRASESSHGTKRLESRLFESALVPIASESQQRSLIAQQSMLLQQGHVIAERQLRVNACKKSLMRSVLEGQQ